METSESHSVALTRECRYVIDAEDRLSRTGPGWPGFARRNDASDLAETTRLLGRPIWEFVDGEEVREVYRIIFRRMRQGERSLSFPFRCDSPAARRYPRMEVAPLPREGLSLSSRLLREEPRDRELRLLNRRSRRTDGLLRICSWCLRVFVGDEWVEIETGVERLSIFAAEGLPRLSHGICSRCAAPWVGKTSDESTRGGS